MSRGALTAPAPELACPRCSRRWGDAFYILDSSWRFVIFNASVERVTNRHRSATIGQTVWDVFPAAPRDSKFWVEPVAAWTSAFQCTSWSIRPVGPRSSCPGSDESGLERPCVQPRQYRGASANHREGRRGRVACAQRGCPDSGRGAQSAVRTDAAGECSGGHGGAQRGPWLYIVKEIVAGHGGQINVSSSEAEGTTFTVLLLRRSAQSSGQG